MTQKGISKGNKIIADFMDFGNTDGNLARKISPEKFRQYVSKKDLLSYHRNWEWLMPVVEKIEDIIGHAIEIHNHIELAWWYSKKLTITFHQGSDPKSKWTEKRKPFDSIGGKIYYLNGYYLKDLKFKPKKEEIAKDKREAVWNVCVRWIKWYNENVVGKK